MSDTHIANLDGMARETTNICYICSDTLPSQPWHDLCLVDGKVVARPKCDDCDRASSDAKPRGKDPT